jgi:NADPH:quinone reductase
VKAIQITAYGGPEVLALAEVPTPEPAAGQARVRVEAVGVNFIDVYHRTGAYQGQLPLIPGREAAGVVDALGSGVTGLQVGQRVAFALVPAAYGECVVSAASKLGNSLCRFQSHKRAEPKALLEKAGHQRLAASG